MANGRLVVDGVKLQKAGAELINIIKSSKEKLTSLTFFCSTMLATYN